jgi:hypothetical protein
MALLGKSWIPAFAGMSGKSFRRYFATISAGIHDLWVGWVQGDAALMTRSLMN